MPDSKNTSTTKRASGAPSNSNRSFMEKIAEKIKAAENVLVALSNNPTVDEMTAALGLTIFLDQVGKHATAIYSGTTPNALEFLRPKETFKPDTDSLQDFIIALNKDKADHLRYKLDGEYVKVFITPYKEPIEADDLEFSHGDYNVDLVIALNVPTPSDLDGALFEHGRILHDAAAIDITTNKPGKFGEIEWSDPMASSVSEMVASLALALKSDKVDKEIATAFLTGIVAATNRFSNQRTTPDTMLVASKLMGLGADQQLVSEHIMKGGGTGLLDENGMNGQGLASVNNTNDATTLAVAHGGQSLNQTGESKVELSDQTVVQPVVPEIAAAATPIADKPEVAVETASAVVNKEAALANDATTTVETAMTSAAAESTTQVEPQAEPVVQAEVAVPVEPVTPPEKVQAPVLDTAELPIMPPQMTAVGAETAGQGEDDKAVLPPPPELKIDLPEAKVLEPAGVAATPSDTPVIEGGTKDYAKMMEAALAEPMSSEAPTINPATLVTPVAPVGPKDDNIPKMNYLESEPELAQQPEVVEQPLAMGEDSYLMTEPKRVVMPTSGVSGEAEVGTPEANMAAPAVDSTAAGVATSTMPTAPVADASAFQIPGMQQ